ncbi:hypothetical protein RchiOBHm_Chr7g0228951 [Rosa chinensis]|uniref:Uncharacterized protein n=1 Tax=Rosa chinensis TaxID=74649 RepID=A0A2P6PF25_ROSCH|nr:hypothetical protein RchiOBHm_Chr7g0228951 [Rosa chinensis]
MRWGVGGSIAAAERRNGVLVASLLSHSFQRLFLRPGSIQSSRVALVKPLVVEVKYESLELVAADLEVAEKPNSSEEEMEEAVDVKDSMEEVVDACELPSSLELVFIPNEEVTTLDYSIWVYLFCALYMMTFYDSL